MHSGATLLERIDPDAGALLGEAFEADGIEVRTSTRPTAVEAGGGRVRLMCTGDGAGEIEGAQLLLAVGRQPNVEGFGLEKLAVTIERTGLQVDDRVCAGENVWGIGDVTGKSLFTHVGKYQARIAAANVAGGNERADYRAVPASVFTDPQVASVGDTSGEGAVSSKASIESVSRTSTYAAADAARVREALRRSEAQGARRRGRASAPRRASGSASSRSPSAPRSRCDAARHDPAVPDLLRDRLLRGARPRRVAGAQLTASQTHACVASPSVRIGQFADAQTP